MDGKGRVRSPSKKLPSAISTADGITGSSEKLNRGCSFVGRDLSEMKRDPLKCGHSVWQKGSAAHPADQIERPTCHRIYRGSGAGGGDLETLRLD